MSECTWNGVRFARCVASRPRRFTLISPTSLEGQFVLHVTCDHSQGVVTPSHPGLAGSPPTKWSPSSSLNTNSVLSGVMPSDARRSKNVAKAAS